MRIRRLLLLLGLTSSLWIGGAQPAAAEIKTFSFTGAEQTYTVPAGVRLVHVVAIGAQGGHGQDAKAPGGEGGFGARLEADLPVEPGQVLFVEVGGRGEDGSPIGTGGGAGGFNGGGSSNPGDVHTAGGGGGGATDVRTCSRDAAACAGAANTLNSRLLIAAGGGGGGGQGGEGLAGSGRGGNAGQDGAKGSAAECNAIPPGGGGGAGTLSAGGAGGAGDPAGTAPAGQPGAFGLGGAAGVAVPNPRVGGGGGGGYFGGGAGGSANGCRPGGGGGGSSFAVAAASSVSLATTAEPAGVAIVTPTSAFVVGKLSRNKRRGTALLAVDVPGPGTVSLSGRGLVQRQVSMSGAGQVKLAIKARGRLGRKLRRTGKLTLKASLSFAPLGADPTTQTRPVKLVRLKKIAGSHRKTTPRSSSR
jgi:hypothetical protein